MDSHSKHAPKRNLVGDRMCFESLIQSEMLCVRQDNMRITSFKLLS